MLMMIPNMIGLINSQVCIYYYIVVVAVCPFFIYVCTFHFIVSFSCAVPCDRHCHRRFDAVGQFEFVNIYSFPLLCTHFGCQQCPCGWMSLNAQRPTQRSNPLLCQCLPRSMMAGHYTRLMLLLLRPSSEPMNNWAGFPNDKCVHLQNKSGPLNQYEGPNHNINKS